MRNLSTKMLFFGFVSSCRLSFTLIFRYLMSTWSCLALAATAASLADAQSCRSAAAQQCRDRIFQMIQQHSQDFTGGDVSVLCS